MARATSPEQLVRLLERVWPSHPVEKSGEEHMVLCPFCDSDKNKCAVNPNKGVFQCWVCGERGPTLKLLMHLKNLHLITDQDIDAVRAKKGVAGLSSAIQEYRIASKQDPINLWSSITPCVFPPKTYAITEFRPHNLFEGKIHRLVTKYLNQRGMDEGDIAEYRMHFCAEVTSRYYGHVFFPALGEFGKQLTFWTTRSIIPNAKPKSLHAGHKYARFSAKQIIFNEHRVTGDSVAICEGPFDAFSIMKVTGVPAIPLLGKQLHDLHKNFINDNKDITTVYICMDPDAQKEQGLISRAFLSKRVYQVVLDPGEDPNSVDPKKLYAAFKEATYKEDHPWTEICSKL